MTRSAILASVTVAVLTAGCGSQVPMAASYPLQYQHHMQSAAHWRVLAADLAAKVKAQADDAGAAGHTAKPVYLQPQQAGTPFGDGLRTYLATELLGHGVAVAERPEGAMVLRFTTQLVGSQSDRPHRSPPGALTLAGGALGALAYVGNQPRAAEAGAATAVGLLADLGAGDVNEPTNTEMIFTAQLDDGDIVRLRTTDTFYVNDQDIAHYEGAAPHPARLIAY